MSLLLRAVTGEPVLGYWLQTPSSRGLGKVGASLKSIQKDLGFLSRSVHA